MSGDPASTVVEPSRSAKIADSAAEAARAHRLRVIFCFFAIYIIWGSTYLAIRFAIETIPPFVTAGLRHLTAGSILLLWCLWKRLRPTWAQMRASVVVGALFFLGGHGSLHWAEQKVPSGLASLLIATEPIFVFALSSMVARKWRMNATLFAGVVLGLAGVGLLLQGSASKAGSGVLTGCVAVLAGAISWAAGIVYSRRSGLSGHPLLLSALSLLAGAAQLLMVAWVLGETRGFSLGAVSKRSWMALAYLILFGSVVAFTSYNWLMEHYPPTFVAAHTYINPVVAVFLGWLFAGEAVTLNVGIATAAVIVAVVLVDRGTAALSAVPGQAP